MVAVPSESGRAGSRRSSAARGRSSGVRRSLAGHDADCQGDNVLRLKFVFAVLLPAAALCAETGPSEAELRHHIEILASDDFAGRRPGTEGAALAANYIAAAFAEAGLEPTENGSFFEPVPLVERRARKVSGHWTLDGEQGRLGGDDIVALGAIAQQRLAGVPLVFVGYGDPGSDDWAREDVEGRAVLLLTDAQELDAAIADYDQRVRALGENGAVAVIGIDADEEYWLGRRRRLANGRTDLANDISAAVEGYMSPRAARALFDAADIDDRRIVEDAGRADFSPIVLPGTINFGVTTELRPITGQNIVGRISGSSGGEAVLFLAHYDHLGECGQAADHDRICNGAVDNASGVAALIEIARVLASGPAPGRDIYFVATTAEEEGLLGATAFAERPPLPLEDIVAAFNLDTVAIAPAGAAAGIVGRGRTPLDPLIDETAASLGRLVDSDTDLDDLVERQDGWALLRKGVPAVMVGGSFTDRALLGGFLSGRYHTAADEAEATLELGGALEDVRLQIALGRAFADPERYPSPAR